jgi:tripartite-type tricarboxylate transporter receptor subunit TctC
MYARHLSTLAFAASLACVLLPLAPAASADEPWPNRPVRFISSFPSGSGIDAAARLYADRLAARWGQPVIVENRPGGDGIIGVSAFTAQRDDHTLLFSGSAAVTVLPLVNDKLPYDSARDLSPIASASDVFIPIIVSKSLNVLTLAEFIARVREQPGKLNWAAGPGLPQYVFAAFLKTAGLDMVSVSYREVGPAVQDLSEGRIHVFVQAMTTGLALAQAGKANILAVANSRRAPVAPDVPTVAEAGHPELLMDGFTALFGWRDMPAELRERIAADMRAVAADPTVQTRLASTGQTARAGTAAELAADIEQARHRIASIIRIVGMRPTQ